MRIIKSPLFNILLPIALATGLLYYYKSSVRKAEEIGLGKGTSSFYPVIDNYPVHIKSPAGISLYKEGWNRRGKKNVWLWLGNSQLHGVNQYQPGQYNTIQYFFDSLSVLNTEVLGASYPNANLQEFLVSVLYYSQLLEIKQMIMPVFYDDMREDGIRDEIAITAVAEGIKKDSAYFEGLPAITGLITRDTGVAVSKDDDYSGIKETAQDISERYLNKKMDDYWSVWRARPDFRGNLFNDLYLLRNQVLGIKPGTQRKMIPGRFRDNYKAFKNILQYCADKKIMLLVYIPPVRNDVPLPYDITAYTNFKNDVEKECRLYGAKFINLENIVPAKYWGVKSSTSSFTGEGETDFMHFQEPGHRLLADTIFKTLTSNKIR
ncbi:MAG: hypothetical protein QM791_02725 [Ferruginibacter sp.]